ncbi:MAG: hypothetical protein AABY11_00715, partial [archaeon]
IAPVRATPASTSHSNSNDLPRVPLSLASSVPKELRVSVEDLPRKIEAPNEEKILSPPIVTLTPPVQTVPVVSSHALSPEPVATSPFATDEPSRDSSHPSSFLDEHPARTISPRSAVGSGEIRVEEILSPSTESSPREITENEALETLPFAEVQELSTEDHAYLDRKEREHTQREQHETPLSPGAPSFNPAAPSTENANEDPKQAILRRLKEMMEEEHAKN